MLCWSPAGPSRGGEEEEEGWHWGRWGAGTAPGPFHLLPKSLPAKPREDKFVLGIRRSRKILSRGHGTTGLGAARPALSPLPGHAEVSPAPPRPHPAHGKSKTPLLRSYSAFTPAVLAPSRAGEGWFGVVPLHCSAPACPALSSIKSPRQSRRYLNNHSGKPN